MARKPDGVGREKVRARLGLAVWEVELAADTGLLNRLDDRSFDPVSVGAAESDPEGFRARLALERRCNATEAAARLGVSVERFKRVADAAGLVPVAEEEVRKYGRVLRVRYWRAGDVDELADHVRADEELRAAVVAAGRRAAARKAVATRRRNAEAAKVARAEVEFRRPGDEAGPVEVLAWAVALARAAGTWPGGLRRWRHADDPLVDEFADLLRRARFGRDVLEGLLEDVRARAVEAGESLVPPRAVAAKLGLPIECIEVRVPHLAGHVPGSTLEALAAEPPPWLLAVRADLELDEATARSARRIERERIVLLDSAERATARLGDASVAELFGLPEEAVRLLRPRSGRWSAEYVEGLMRNRPAWTRGAEAAWAEVERRRGRERRRRERRQRKRLEWRRGWARAFGVPLDAVPERVGRPTGKAVRAARAAPPAWAVPRSEPSPE